MKTYPFITMILVIAMAGLFISCDNASANQSGAMIGSGYTNNLTIYNIGDPVKDFSLKNINGEMVSLDSFPEAKGFVVVFSGNTCPYSEMVEDRVISLAKEVKAKGYQLIMINSNNPSVEPKESFAEMQNRAKLKNYSFPYLQDADGKTASNWKVARLPQFYVVQRLPQGNVLQYAGALDDNIRDAGDVKENYVNSVIESIESGNEIRVTTTRSFGCSIKAE